jgi:hypothetical protein
VAEGKRKAVELQAEGKFSLVDVLKEINARRGASGDELS